MMKKLFILLLLIEFTNSVQAQFLRGFGIFIGATSTRHRYVNTLPVDSFTFKHTVPAPSHKSAEYVSWSIGIFGEFLKYSHIRWQTELEYINKGAVERPLIAPWPPVRAGATANAFSYIQWNNFLKIFGNEGYRGTPYGMIGIRSEYNLHRAITAYPGVTAGLPKINFSPDVGIGYEFMAYSPVKFFTELHYMRDAINYKAGPVWFNSRTWELRVGIIYRPMKALDDCNAPRIHGNYN